MVALGAAARPNVTFIPPATVCANAATRLHMKAAKIIAIGWKMTSSRIRSAAIRLAHAHAHAHACSSYSSEATGNKAARHAIKINGNNRCRRRERGSGEKNI